MSTSVYNPSGRSKDKSRPEIRIFSATRRACDGCRLRKIRCDSSQPCSNCRKYSLSCLYLHVPKKSGPRRKSTKIAVPPARSPEKDPPSLNVLERSPSTSSGLSSDSRKAPSEDLFSPASNTENAFQSIEALSARNSMSQMPTPSLESPPCDLPLDSLVFNEVPLIPCTTDSPTMYDAFVDTPPTRLPPIVLLPFLEMFFDHLFPIMPVLDRELYLNSICHQDSISSDQYCLLTAVSAVTIVQLNLTIAFVEQSIPGLSAGLLVEQCLQERNRYEYIDEPTTSTVLTSFFLFGYYGNMEKHNKARHHLHEAISFAEVVGLDDETHLSQLSVGEGQWCRRVFWLLFVTER